MITTTTAAASVSAVSPNPVRRFLGRHPVAAAATLLVGVTWLANAIALLNGWPTDGALLVELALFVGVPIGLSAAIGGKQEVKRLLSGLLRVRIGFSRWLLVLLAMPAVTIAVALATGTFQLPPEGWLGLALAYVVQGLLLSGLTGNVAEETAWGGFVQTRLMSRHGLLVGSILTAIPFGLIHLPLAFSANGLYGTRWTDVALTWGVLIAAAPVLRYLVGCMLVDTRGSLLAVAFLHASFNASGQLSILGGGWWQNVVALFVLTLAVAVHRRVRRVVPGSGTIAAAAEPGLSS